MAFVDLCGRFLEDGGGRAEGWGSGFGFLEMGVAELAWVGGDDVADEEWTVGEREGDMAGVELAVCGILILLPTGSTSGFWRSGLAFSNDLHE